MAAASFTNAQVFVAGPMRNIMQSGDLSAKISLDTLKKENLFALGAVENLKGEILVIDGEIHVSAVNRGRIENYSPSSQAAAMLVYSYVGKWDSLLLDMSIQSYAQLELLMDSLLNKHGYDGSKAVPFKITGTPHVSYHVIDWQTGIPHIPDNHKQFAVSGKMEGEQLILVGFYSEKHKGIFTHHSTYMHIHALNTQTRVVGHIDEILVKGKVMIFIPSTR